MKFSIRKLEERIAPSCCSCTCDDDPAPNQKGNNGVGNGLDPQPPGNPPVNDGTGTAPGSPAARSR